jgi:hypothetical protein
VEKGADAALVRLHPRAALGVVERQGYEEAVERIRQGCDDVNAGRHRRNSGFD